MKNNRLKIYLVVALLLIMGVGYAYLNKSFELDNSVTISSYEKPGVPAPTPVNITILSGERGNLQPGDEIGIGETEDFYVISSDNSENGKTVLLAKYNLMIGYWDQYSGNVPANTPGYGLQSVDAIGYVEGYYYGTLVFSNSHYWDDGDNENPNLLSPYNANGASYSGNPYPYVYNSNSNIYQYINGNDGYVEKLKTIGAPSTITGRLLTYEEADTVKNVQKGGKSIIINGSNYWLGSAYNFDRMWFVNTSLGHIDYDTSDGGGIRPVIEINTSDI